MPLEIYSELFGRRRWLVICFVILMTSLATWGHRRGSPSPWEALAEAQQAENDASNQADETEWDEPAGNETPRVDALLVVQAADFFSPSRIAALRQMVSALEELETVSSVIWLDRVPVMNMFGVPQPLLPPADASEERFDEARVAVMDHPLARGQLISEDGRTLLMPVSVDWVHVSSDYDCSDRILDVARASLDDAGEAGIRVRLTGDVPLFVAQHEALERNHRKFQLIGYVMALVITVALFRGVSAVLIVASAPAAGIYWSLGLLNLMGHSTNTLTNVILPVLVSMVGLTDGVHLMMHIRESRSRGKTQMEACREAIQRVGTACGLTSLTTAIGFGSLMLAHAKFIRSFGEACAIGVIISFIAVVTWIPLLSSSWLGRNVHVGHSRDLISRQLSGTLGMIRWILRYRKQVSVFAVLVTMALTVVSLTLRPDSKTKSSLPTGSDIYDALVHCDEAMGGIDSARVVIKWPESLQATDPTIYHVVEQVQGVVEDQPLLRHPLSIRDLLSTFPMQQPELATRMSFLQLLPPPLLSLFFDESVRQTFVTVRIQDVGIAKYEPVFREVEDEFRKIAERYPGFQISLTGEPVRRGRDLYRVVIDLSASLGAASIVIFVVLTIVYRSLRLGLISVIPNMFPLVVTASVLVVMGGALDFASVCAFTVCLGIAVDDTIHFLTRYQFERKGGVPMPDAICNAYLGVGTALVTTTVILVMGFGTTMTSELPDHRMFAGMACATIGSALVGDLIFLPALLACFPGRDKGTDSSPVPHSNSKSPVQNS